MLSDLEPIKDTMRSFAALPIGWADEEDSMPATEEAISQAIAVLEAFGVAPYYVGPLSNGNVHLLYRLGPEEYRISLDIECAGVGRNEIVNYMVAFGVLLLLAWCVTWVLIKVLVIEGGN